MSWSDFLQNIGTTITSVTSSVTNSAIGLLNTAVDIVFPGQMIDVVQGYYPVVPAPPPLPPQGPYVHPGGSIDSISLSDQRRALREGIRLPPPLPPSRYICPQDPSELRRAIERRRRFIDSLFITDNVYTNGILIDMAYQLQSILDGNNAGQTRAYYIRGLTSNIDFTVLIRGLYRLLPLINELRVRGNVDIYDDWGGSYALSITAERIRALNVLLDNPEETAAMCDYDGIATGFHESMNGILPGSSQSELRPTFRFTIIEYQRRRQAGTFSRYYNNNESHNLEIFQIYKYNHHRSKDKHCLIHSLEVMSGNEITIPAELLKEDGMVGTNKLSVVAKANGIGIALHRVGVGIKYFPGSDRKIPELEYYHICIHDGHYMPWFTRGPYLDLGWMKYNNTLTMITSLIETGYIRKLDSKKLEEIGKSSFIDSNGIDYHATGPVKSYVGTFPNVIYMLKINKYQDPSLITKIKLISDIYGSNDTESYLEHIRENGGPDENEQKLIDVIYKHDSNHELLDALVKVEDHYVSTLKSSVRDIEVTMLMFNGGFVPVASKVVYSIEEAMNLITMSVPRVDGGYERKKVVDNKAAASERLNKYLEGDSLCIEGIDYISDYKAIYDFFRYSSVNNGLVETIPPNVYDTCTFLNIPIVHKRDYMMVRIYRRMLTLVLKRYSPIVNNSKSAGFVKSLLNENIYRPPTHKGVIPVYVEDMYTDYPVLVSYLSSCSLTGTLGNPKSLKCNYADISLKFRSVPKEVTGSTHAETVSNFIAYDNKIYNYTSQMLSRGLSISMFPSIASLGKELFFQLGAYEDTRELGGTLRHFIQTSASSTIVGTYDKDLHQVDKVVSYDYSGAFLSSIVELTEYFGGLPNGSPLPIPSVIVGDLKKIQELNSSFWLEITVNKLKDMPYPVIRRNQVNTKIVVSHITLLDLIKHHGLTADDFDIHRGIYFPDPPDTRTAEIVRDLHSIRCELLEHNLKEDADLIKHLAVSGSYGINSLKPKTNKLYIKTYKEDPIKELPGVETIGWQVLSNNRIAISKESHSSHSNCVHRGKLILDYHNLRMRTLIREIIDAGEKVYYVGVDSLHCSPGAERILESHKGPKIVLGSLGPVFKGKSGRAIYSRAGVYCIETPEDDSPYYWRMAGFPREQIEKAINDKFNGNAYDLYKYYADGNSDVYEIGKGINRTLKFNSNALHEHVDCSEISDIHTLFSNALSN